MLRVNKLGIQFWLGSIVFFAFLLLGINSGSNKEYQKEMVLVFFVLGMMSFVTYLLTAKNKSFLLTIVTVSFSPPIFGLLMVGIAIWKIEFTPHWNWISIVLGAYWGMWLLPFFLPKISKQIEVEIMQPKTTLGKIIVGILVAIGGFGGASSGRLASKGVESGANWGMILGGMGIISLAFMFQYLAVLSQWQYFQDNREPK